MALATAIFTENRMGKRALWSGVGVLANIGQVNGLEVFAEIETISCRMTGAWRGVFFCIENL